MNVTSGAGVPANLAAKEWYLPRDDALGPWPGFSARDLLSLYAPAEYERFICEWADESVSKRYASVRNNAGSGDKGRDVIGYLTTDISISEFDIFQCKHYSEPLQPHHVWLELGKLCYHTFKKHYRVPRYYYLVAPRGIGSTLNELLEDPDELRIQLMRAWEKYCEPKLVSGTPVSLTGELRTYVEQFNLRIVKAMNPDELLKEHRQTRWHAIRFGREHLVRPTPQSPPDAVSEEEVRYVQQLLDAYADHLRVRIDGPHSLSAHPKYAQDLSRQRIRYYRAVSLRRFEQDSYPDDRYFTELVDEIHRGVLDICEEDCSSGYVRLGKTLQAARNLHITKYPLRDFLDTDDKAGICHHLANDDLLLWCEPQAEDIPS